MQLLARIFIPSTGMILYPTRWRVRFADVPRLFDRDLMYAASPPRVVARAARRAVLESRPRRRRGLSRRHPLGGR